MSIKRVSSAGRATRDERGDPSDKALKVTIVVCLIGLIAVYLFAFAPKPGARTPATPRPTAVGTVTKAKEPVAKFDRESLSTKNQ